MAITFIVMIGILLFSIYWPEYKRKKKLAEKKFAFIYLQINVMDLDKSIEFYKKALGFNVASRYESDDGNYKSAFIEDDPLSLTIVLAWNRDKNEPYDHDNSKSYTAFEVQDYEATYALHKEMGCICDEDKSVNLYIIADPDGCRYLITPKKILSELSRSK